MYCELSRRGEWVVVLVLGGGRDSRHGEHLLMSLLESVDAALEVDIVGGELGLEKSEWLSRRPVVGTVLEGSIPLHHPGQIALSQIAGSSEQMG